MLVLLIICLKIGVKQKLLAFSYAGPGVIYSSDKLELNYNDINSYVINITPDGDIVSRIDKLGGLIQTITCGEGPVSCHNVVLIAQKLIQACGSDSLGRWIEAHNKN